MNRLDFLHTGYSSGESVPPQRLLIVDDEALMRISLRSHIDGLELDVVECATGCAAITTLESGDFDLVLLDIGLPDISGLEVMEWISKNSIQTLVIIVSADDSIDSAILALRKGAVEFIRKPDELADISQKVVNALYRRSLERSNAQMTAQLKHSEQLHRFLVENSPDLIYTLDTSGCFTFINNRVESLLGFTRDELIGSHYCTIIHDDDLEKARYAFVERRRSDRAVANLEVRLKYRNTSIRSFVSNQIVSMLSSYAIYDETNTGKLPVQQNYLGTYGVARDITERKIAEETIAFQAFHDLLTLLPNQQLFKDRLEMALVHTKRNRGMLAVMFIDLDRFKLVNDTYGHASGDELLKDVALRLRHCMRASDTLARKGGDEFTVLLPDIVNAEDARVIAEKILDELKLPFRVADQAVHISASIGIAVSPEDGDSVDVLLKKADMAMYGVKARGKNGFTYFISAVHASNSGRISLENDLRTADLTSEFQLYYQPQINVSRNEIVGMEALVRWNHPVRGLLEPSSFIELAEETGLIDSLTDWVLGEACKQLAKWRANGLEHLRISVNISPREFENSDIIERILPHIICNGLPADSIEIEITENILLHDVPTVINKMRVLRNHGMRISIDDFGTCYSSLKFLRHFPISTIKIDQSFVCDLADAQCSSPIIQAIIAIARGYGLHLLAEGVETAAQMHILKELGCNEMQGYYFSKPLPAEEADQLSTDPRYFLNSQKSRALPGITLNA